MPRAVPIDPAKMLDAARDFAHHGGGPGRPKSIWLRRAVSSAYYALFHSVCRQAADYLLPSAPLDARLSLTRSFQHPQMKKACEWIAARGGRVHQHVLQSSSLVGVAGTFCDLQQARHDADYNHLYVITKPTAIACVDEAERAIETLTTADQRDREEFFSMLAVFVKL